jgi:predicted  nucleic acid-binding Zn-ribbon protein
VAVGGSPISEYITGHHWPENVTSTAGTIARVHVANEVHAVTQAGFHSWQNRGVGHDIVAAHAWGINAGSGILHGAYGFPLRWYRARLVGNRIAYDGTVVTGFLQDSLIEGRGLTAPALLVPDTGVAVGSYSIQPHPMRPWHLLRNTIRDLTPAANGTRGAGVRQSHDLCTQGALELKALTRDCTANFFTIKQNTFGPGIQPLDFGWSTNANTHWITDTAVLLRRDMATPRGEFPPKLVKAATSFDQASGALSTPLSSLPPTIVWTGLLSYRNRPHRDYVLQTAYDEPPTISLDVVRTGTIVRLTAIASADTTRVEFWQNWTLLGSDDQAPFELTADLNAPPSDTLAPQRYAFVYARAFDGTIIDAGGGEGTGPGPAGYAQRAYSRVVQFGPEVLLGQVVPPGPPQPPPQPPSPPQPPTIDQLIKQIAALEASLKASQAATAAALAERDAARTQRDSALAQVTSLQAQISKLQAELSTAQAARTTAETALTALRARLAQVLTKLAEVQALLSAAVITPGSSASTAATASTAYDVSPAITSGMERKGTAVALIAAVNPGESRLDFWQRVLANRTRAPFELTTDLAVPYGNRRVVLGPEVRHAEAPSPGPEAQSQPPTIDQLLAQVAALEASLKTSQAATTAALAERDAARTARDTALTQVTSLQTQITKLQGDLSATQAARTAAETARAGLQARLAQALAKLAEVQALLNQ